ncbi:unnamed protein product [Owenia fusiformis]|uniref:BTB domain-containing protein n=1 Tax=Owenia fusiformis TaxID=6347 RepID=A0A8S4PUM4_OWEFU|nr:unnamed protein product [Owenia fusiformis]
MATAGAPKSKDFDNKINESLFDKPLDDTCTRQWGLKILRFSSQYNNTSWSANSVLGPPRVYPQYGDIGGAWASDEIDAAQFIEIQYKKKLYVKRIDIYETYNSGGVMLVSALSPKGNWVTLWHKDAPEVIDNSRIFAPPLKKTDFKTDSLRLDIDCSAANSWCEIDAVEMYGREHRIDPPSELGTMAVDLATLINSDLFCDVIFDIDGHKVCAHRAILAARSEYFRAMFCDGMKESSGQYRGPFVKKAIPLPEISYNAFMGILSYLYTNNLKQDLHPFVLVELLRAGDRLNMETLRHLAIFYLNGKMKVKNVVDIYREATEKLPILDDVRSMCLDFISYNFAAVTKSRAFCNLPQDLMLEIIQQTAKDLSLED